MSTTEDTDLQAHVKTLAKKAAESERAIDALQLSQAALNVANAWGAITPAKN